MRTEADVGVILRVRPYLEYDAIITIFGEDAGKNSLLRKGLRRPRSRLSGIIRPFSVIRFEKSVPAHHEALASLISAELLHAPAAQSDPILLFIAEVAEKIIREGQRHTAFFGLLSGLPPITYSERYAAAFLLKSLTLLGFLPRYEICPVSKQKFSGRGFWQLNGEIISDGNQDGGVAFEFDEIKVLRFWQIANLELCEKVVVSSTTLKKIYGVLFEYLEHEHGILLKSKSLVSG